MLVYVEENAQKMAIQKARSVHEENVLTLSEALEIHITSELFSHPCHFLMSSEKEENCIQDEFLEFLQERK